MKKFNDLTIEELKIVFDNNTKIQDETLNAAQEDITYWINEYMESFEPGTLEYNIGYPGDYLSVNNIYEFVQGLRRLQEDFCYLSEENEKTIDYIDLLITRYNNLPYYDTKNANKIDLRIEELTEQLSNAFFHQLIKEYNYYYNSDNLKEYFIEIYADNMNGDFYVDDNYILYQHIEKEVCYK